MKLIDADALMESVKKWLPEDPCGKEEKEFPFETDICVSMLMEINEQPTITLEPHWIPVTERLPETDMYRTLTTIRTPHKGTNVRSGHFYKGFFCNDNGDTWNATDKEVLAWMPEPEPYKGVTI